MFDLIFSTRTQRSIIMGVGVSILILGFQNCGKNHHSFTLDQSSYNKEVAVPVTEHAFEKRTLTTNYTLNLSERRYLAAIFSDVFGPKSDAIVQANILLKHDDIGGPCSEYAHHMKKNVSDKGVVSYANADAKKVCDEENTTKLLLPPPQAVRQGWVIQTCTALVGKDSTPPETLAYALDKVVAGSTFGKLPLVTDENLARLHRLFYRERPLPSDSVRDALKSMFQGGTPTLEEWKTAIYSVCVSSHWQVL